MIVLFLQMNRRNLKRRRLNERFDADSSSSDEDWINATRSSEILAGDRTNISRINVIAVANMILQTVTSFDIREGFIVNSLIPLLHERTYHFCHEFYNFASSPYDMDDYDRNVRFTFEFETAPPLRENVK